MNPFISLLIIVATLVVIGLLIVLPGWHRSRSALTKTQRRRLVRLLPWAERLDRRRRARLFNRTARILADVPILSAADSQLPKHHQLTIAGQIGLLSLGVQARGMPLPAEIAVLPWNTDIPDAEPMTGLIEDVGELAIGGDWQRVRLSVSWAAVRKALVGGPDNPLVRQVAQLQWRALIDSAPETATESPWVEAIRGQRHALSTGDQTLLTITEDSTDADFFAIAAEIFFQRGEKLADAQPDLYALLAAHFDLDTTPVRPTGHRTPAPGNERPEAPSNHMT